MISSPGRRKKSSVSHRPPFPRPDKLYKESMEKAKKSDKEVDVKHIATRFAVSGVEIAFYIIIPIIIGFYVGQYFGKMGVVAGVLIGAVFGLAFAVRMAMKMTL